MPVVPLIIGGIAAAGAATGAAAQLEKGVGRNEVGSTSFERTQGYDPNASRFGGSEGGLAQYVTSVDQRSQAADARGAYQANYGDAFGQRQNALGQRENALGQRQNALLARGRQTQVADMMMARAQGQTPSIAAMQGAQDMRRAQAAQGAQAASARGAAGMALAQQNAANNTANAQSAISSATQVNAANERLQAEQGAMGAYSQIRGGDAQGQNLDLNAQQTDIGAQAQDANQAQFQAGMQQQNRNANDARSMGYQQLAGQAMTSEMQARTQNQGTLAHSLDNSETLNYQRRSDNAKNERALWDKLIPSDERMKDTGAGYSGGLAANSLGSSGTGDNKSDDMAGKFMQAAQLYSSFSSDTAAKAQAKGWGTEEWMQKDPAGFQKAGMLARGRRDPESFRRDTPGDQRNVRQAYYDNVARDAAKLEAGYRESLAQGPAARRLASGTPENDYETELTQGAEAAFQRKYGEGRGDDYDLRGAHAEGLTDRARPEFEVGDDGEIFPIFRSHLPDTYKKPSHETFSNESQYAPYEPERAGRWEGDRYVPPTRKLQPTKVDDGPYQDPDGWDVGDEDFSPDANGSAEARNTPKRKGSALDQWERSFGESSKAKRAVLDSDNRAEADKIRESFRSDEDEKPPMWAQLLGAYGNTASGAGNYGFTSDKAAKVKQPGEGGSKPPAAAEPKADPNRPMGHDVTGQKPGPFTSDEKAKQTAYLQGQADAHNSVAKSIGDTGLGPVRQGVQGLVSPGHALLAAGQAAREMGHLKKRDQLDAEIADANRAMEGQPYTYKAPHTPPNEQPGQPHVGFMAQNLQKNPVTATAVEKGPDGLLRVDRDRMLQVAATGISGLQKQMDKVNAVLALGKKKERK